MKVVRFGWNLALVCAEERVLEDLLAVLIYCEEAQIDGEFVELSPLEFEIVNKTLRKETLDDPST